MHRYKEPGKRSKAEQTKKPSGGLERFELRRLKCPVE
jgi:hypothetical protein